MDVTAPDAKSFAELDKAGIGAAEDAMRANPNLDYVDITARGITPDGVPMISSGGWSRDAMMSGGSGALYPGNVNWYSNILP